MAESIHTVSVDFIAASAQSVLRSLDCKRPADLAAHDWLRAPQMTYQMPPSLFSGGSVHSCQLVAVHASLGLGIWLGVCSCCIQQVSFVRNCCRKKMSAFHGSCLLR